jgi:N-methylhydantoinase B
VSALADRTTVPAPGADGGHDGATGEVSVDGRPLPTKRLVRLAPEARVRLDLPGGGGVGDPRARDPQAVLRDVVDGYVSIAAAKALYGVTIRQTRQGRVLLPEDFEIQEEA